MTKRLPITGLPIGGISTQALVCGDPARVDKIAAQLSNVELLSDRREYRSVQGMANGRLITVCSHGVGAPGAAIAFEELIAAGARQIVRVGTCGGMQPAVGVGDLVIATAVVQGSSYGEKVAPPGYPAAADVALTYGLQQAAVEAKRPFHSGIVLSSDVFYPGVGENRAATYQLLADANVWAVEMECAALFVIGSLRRVQTAAILAVDGNVLNAGESMDTYEPDRQLVQTAVEDAVAIVLNTLSR